MLVQCTPMYVYIFTVVAVYFQTAASNRFNVHKNISQSSQYKMYLKLTRCASVLQ